MRLQTKAIAAIAAVAMLAIGVGGCGNSDTKTTTSNAAAVGTQSTASATAAAQLASKDSSLGTILSGDKNLTVYMFEADKNGKSACDSDCAAVWPPVLTTGDATVAPDAQSSKLGTTKRADGKTQVTYGGWPLYYYVKDKDAEDVYGQGIDSFGAEWYVLAPNGKKIEASASSSSSSDSSGGY